MLVEHACYLSTNVTFQVYGVGAAEVWYSNELPDAAVLLDVEEELDVDDVTAGFGSVFLASGDDLATFVSEDSLASSAVVLGVTPAWTATMRRVEQRQSVVDVSWGGGEGGKIIYTFSTR